MRERTVYGREEGPREAERTGDGREKEREGRKESE